MTCHFENLTHFLCFLKRKHKKGFLVLHCPFCMGFPLKTLSNDLLKAVWVFWEDVLWLYWTTFGRKKRCWGGSDLKGKTACNGVASFVMYVTDPHRHFLRKQGHSKIFCFWITNISLKYSLFCKSISDAHFLTYLEARGLVWKIRTKTTKIMLIWFQNDVFYPIEWSL